MPQTSLLVGSRNVDCNKQVEARVRNKQAATEIVRNKQVATGIMTNGPRTGTGLENYCGKQSLIDLYDLIVDQAPGLLTVPTSLTIAGL